MSTDGKFEGFAAASLNNMEQSDVIKNALLSSLGKEASEEENKEMRQQSILKKLQAQKEELAQPVEASTIVAEAPVVEPIPEKEESPMEPIIEQVQETAVAEEETVSESMEQAIITSDMVIEGSIVAKSPIRMDGVVIGNIMSVNDLLINGQVEGDLQGRSIALNGCTIQGNIKGENNIVIDADSIVVGNLSGQKVITDGKIKGNISIEETATLKSNAVVFGDITARAISTEEGAIIQGSVKLVDKQTVTNDVFNIASLKTKVKQSTANKAKQGAGQED